MIQSELRILGGKFQGKAIPLNLKRFLVGREQDCHLRPNSESVSRHHCAFIVDDFGVRVRDLGSTNGTKVNGQVIRHETQLNDGDKIQIGKLQLEISVREVAAVPANAAVGAVAGSAGTTGTNAAEASAASTPGFEVPSTTAGADTSYEMPAFAPSESSSTVLANDTAIMGGGQSAQPGMPQGYPQYPPGYPMPGYPMAGGYPGYPPGYPMGYPAPMPGYPMAGGYPGYPPGYPAPAAPAETPAEPQAASQELPTRLPPPESTGAKDPVAPAPAPAGQQAAPTAVNPSTSAADIIKGYMQRRNT